MGRIARPGVIASISLQMSKHIASGANPSLSIERSLVHCGKAFFCGKRKDSNPRHSAKGFVEDLACGALSVRSDGSLSRSREPAVRPRERIPSTVSYRTAFEVEALRFSAIYTTSVLCYIITSGAITSFHRRLARAIKQLLFRSR